MTSERMVLITQLSQSLSSSKLDSPLLILSLTKASACSSMCNLRQVAKLAGHRDGHLCEFKSTDFLKRWTRSRRTDTCFHLLPSLLHLLLLSLVCCCCLCSSSSSACKTCRLPVASSSFSWLQLLCPTVHGELGRALVLALSLLTASQKQPPQEGKSLLSARPD